MKIGDQNSQDQNAQEQGTDTAKSLCGVFCLEGVMDKSAVKIKHLGNVEVSDGETIRDTPLKKIDIVTSKKIVAYVMACNITHTAILASKKQPMLSVAILKENPLKSIPLFRFFFFFKNETDVQSAEEFLSKTLYGKFSLEAEIEGQFQSLDMTIDQFPGNEELINKIEEFLKTEEMVEFLEGLLAVEEEKQRVKFEEEFGRFVDPKRFA